MVHVAQSAQQRRRPSGRRFRVRVLSENTACGCEKQDRTFCHFLIVSDSSSSSVLGQSSRIKRDNARSASSFPPVWQLAQ